MSLELIVTIAYGYYDLVLCDNIPELSPEEKKRRDRRRIRRKMKSAEAKAKAAKSAKAKAARAAQVYSEADLEPKLVSKEGESFALTEGLEDNRDILDGPEETDLEETDQLIPRRLFYYSRHHTTSSKRTYYTQEQREDNFRKLLSDVLERENNKRIEIEKENSQASKRLATLIETMNKKNEAMKKKNDRMFAALNNQIENFYNQMENSNKMFEEAMTKAMTTIAQSLSKNK